MTVRIVTDSTCDLPAETIAHYGIHVVPLYINVGKQSFLDNVDITRQEFYEKLPFFPEHPTTAVPSIERFRVAYIAMAEEGASEVLSIHVSSSLSAIVDVARMAAKEMTEIPVTVIDSQQLSLGSGFMVETAAKMAAEGKSAEEIKKALEDQSQRSYVFAALDTLEYLKRSGRMNKYLAGFATMLQVKPILKMHKGVPSTERVRTRERALHRIVEMLAAVGALERVALVHTHALPERVAKLRAMAEHLLPTGDLIVEDITPVIGAHLGPGAIGFAAVAAKT